MAAFTMHNHYTNMNKNDNRNMERTNYSKKSIIFILKYQIIYFKMNIL